MSKDRGHTWQTCEDSDDIDIFAFNPEDPHNGPRCVNCGYGYCCHCLTGPGRDCTKESK